MPSACLGRDDRGTPLPLRDRGRSPDSRRSLHNPQGAGPSSIRFRPRPLIGAVAATSPSRLPARTVLGRALAVVGHRSRLGRDLSGRIRGRNASAQPSRDPSRSLPPPPVRSPGRAVRGPTGADVPGGRCASGVIVERDRTVRRHPGAYSYAGGPEALARGYGPGLQPERGLDQGRNGSIRNRTGPAVGPGLLVHIFRNLSPAVSNFGEIAADRFFDDLGHVAIDAVVSGKSWSTLRVQVFPFND